MAGHRADRDGAVGEHLDPLKLDGTVQVDERVRASQAELEARHQRLAAGERHCTGRNGGQRTVEIGCTLVAKGCRSHYDASR
jgi:hypothetical protein